MGHVSVNCTCCKSQGVHEIPIKLHRATGAISQLINRAEKWRGSSSGKRLEGCMKTESVVRGRSRGSVATNAAIQLESCVHSDTWPADSNHVQYVETPGRIRRTWGPICPSDNSSEQQQRNPQQLVVLTFNVLADGLDVHGDFVKATADALSWQNRRALILEEVIASQAHIVCLQECNNFSNFYAPRLAALGYNGVFLAKCGSPANQFGCPSDGVALFHRADYFRAASSAEGKTFTDQHGRTAAQCMLMQRLACLHSGRELIVATFHFKAKAGPQNDATRQTQAQQAADVVEGMRRAPTAAQTNSSEGMPDVSDTAVLLCGDMNAEPGSAAWQVFQEHALHLRSLWEFQLESKEQETELFTTWKYRSDGEKRCVIDYIWSSKHLQATRRWVTPTITDIGPQALPCAHYGSDHIAVAAEFNWSL